MKKIVKFHQALKAAIDRATVRHKQVTGKALTLPKIAKEVGIELVALMQALHGEKSLARSQLLPLLVYLGCDEEEQRGLFHLAEFATSQNTSSSLESITDELPAATFLSSDTEPGLERITEQHHSL